MVGMHEATPGATAPPGELSQTIGVEQQLSLSLFDRARGRLDQLSFDEHGMLGLGFVTWPGKVVKKGLAAGHEHKVLATLIAGAVGGVGLVAVHAWRGLETTFDPDMQGGHIEAKSSIISFDEVMDMRVAKVDFETDVNANVTVKVGGPGPDWLYPDYDSDYHFKGYGRCNLFVDWSNIQQQLDGNDLTVTLDPKDTWMECSWLKTTNGQKDDFERNFERYYDALGDAIGAVLPGVSGSSMDEKMNQTDDNIRQAMSGKALDEFDAQCSPQIQAPDKQAVEDFADALAAFQNTNTKTITYVWKPGEVGVKLEEDLPKLSEDEISLDSFDFDKSSCDTTKMKINKQGANNK